MDGLDPAKKQYWIFSGITAFIIALVINFGLLSLFKGTIIYGFPINYGDSVGLANFLIKIVDSLVIGAILTPGVYYFLNYLQHRG